METTWQVADVKEPLERLMRPEEVAELLGVKVGTVYQLVRERKLTCVRIGKKLIRFRRCDYENYIRE